MKISDETHTTSNIYAYGPVVPAWIFSLGSKVQDPPVVGIRVGARLGWRGLRIVLGYGFDSVSCFSLVVYDRVLSSNINLKYYDT